MFKAADLMIPEKKQRLGHLLQVINRRPPGIAGTLFLQLGLDIDYEIYRFLRSPISRRFTFALFSPARTARMSTSVYPSPREERRMKRF